MTLTLRSDASLQSGKNFVLSQVSFIAASCGGLETCSRLPAEKDF